MLHRSLTVKSEPTEARMDVVAEKVSRISKPEFRKWGLLCSFLITAGFIVMVLCQTGFPDEFKRDQARLMDEISGNKYGKLAFVNTMDAFGRWDKHVGCAKFREKYSDTVANMSRPPPRLQNPGAISCGKMKQKHVSVRVQSWTWIPDSLNNLYSCNCGLTCLWTKSEVLADSPDALLYEMIKPPTEPRHQGNPLRVYVDLEPEKQPAPYQNIFVSYHHSSDVQATYAGALFHNTRNYYVSQTKHKDALVYWSSSRCLPARQEIASSFLSLVGHHSFGKCLNNVGGTDATFTMYPVCQPPENGDKSWGQHLHCAMSHYKFVLAIENTMTQSYVTEKLFYALDAGSVPIYFGAPNVQEFVPPNSIIDGSKFSSMKSLADYVKQLANDPVRYAEYHAWRRCGVMGNYYWTRAVSLDSLPCRLCAHISSLGGKMMP